MNALLLAVVAMAAPGPGKYAPVNGLKLYYEVHGTGEPVVLLHGGGSTLETSFKNLIPKLAKTRRVIAFDQAGHGRTADADRPFSFEQSADDAVALLEHLGLSRADFIGYSNGGSIALQIAIRHPATVRSLVVVSGMFKRDGMADGFWEGMKSAKLDGMPAELRETYLKVSPHPEKLQSFFEKSVQRMLTFKDWRVEDVRGIQAPVLVFAGDRDVVRVEHAVELFRLVPRGRLAIMPETDHAAVLDRLVTELPLIETFLKEAR